MLTGGSKHVKKLLIRPVYKIDQLQQLNMYKWAKTPVKITT